MRLDIAVEGEGRKEGERERGGNESLNLGPRGAGCTAASVLGLVAGHKH